MAQQNETAPEVIVKPKLSTAIIDTEGLRRSVKKGGKAVTVCTIYGIATGIKTVIDKNKDETYYALSGQFEAEYPATRTLFRSGVLYLPSGIHQTVESAVKTLENEGDQVNFAFEMRAVPAENPQGYSWEAKPLLRPATTDPLIQLREQIGQKSLPAGK